MVSGIEAPQQNFDVTKSSPLVCKCGNHTFVAGTFLRKVSALLSPNGTAGILPIPTFLCNACGACPDEVIPQFIKLEAHGETPIADPSGPTVTKSGLHLL